MYIAVDSETARFGPGRGAPRLTCLSSTCEVGSQLIHWTEAKLFLDEVLYDPKYILVGHNICYDLAVVAAEFPEYLPAIFQILEDGRVRDTMIRQKLLDISMGCFRGYYEELTKEERLKGYEKGAWVRLTYDLDAVHYRYTGKKLDKNTWRLRYSEFRNVPLAKWPQGAKDYPLDDSRATWTIFWEQSKMHDALQKLMKQEVPWIIDAEPLADESAQCRAAWWIQLMRVWGIRTNPERVGSLRRATNKLFKKLEEELMKVSLCPVCGMKLKNKYCDKHGGAPWTRVEIKKVGKKGEKKKEEKRQVVFKEPLSLVRRNGVRDTKVAKLRMITAMGGAGKCRRTKKGDIQLDEDACELSGDPLLKQYSELSRLKVVITKDIPALLKGRYLPIHSNFDSLLATGRTSSSKPNIQNIRRLPGIRECFVPRAGKVFLDADYDGLELRTLAQVCMHLFGYSKLAETLNSGKDPHLMVAAEILAISYDEAVRRFDKGDEEVDDARQTGKVANFGFPGGLGIEALISFAKKGYDVTLSEIGAKQLKQQWLSTFPEMSEYFGVIDSICKQDVLDNLATVEHLFSRRIRGNIPYTVACNSLFQGLGSDATKNAGWLISKACYLDKNSPLYGCRIVNYIHDQFLLECDEDKAHEACLELARLMVLGAEPYLPDVPPLVSKPLIARCWSKKAKQMRKCKCERCYVDFVGSSVKDKLVCPTCKFENEIGNTRIVPWEMSNDKKAA